MAVTGTRNRREELEPKSFASRPLSHVVSRRQTTGNRIPGDVDFGQYAGLRGVIDTQDVAFTKRWVGQNFVCDTLEEKAKDPAKMLPEDINTQEVKSFDKHVLSSS